MVVQVINLFLLFIYLFTNSFLLGVGKSAVIQAITLHSERILRCQGDDLHSPRVLVCAPTGKAASIISK